MRHSVRARSLLTLVWTVCAFCALALPASASASGSSPVHVDPSSPVAKEYALPLASARGAPPESGKNGSLFGSGIKHPSGGSSTQHTTTVVAVTPAPAPAQPSPAAPTQPVPAATVPTVATVTQPRSQPATPPVHHRPRPVTTVTLPTLTTPAPARQVAANAAPSAYKVLRPGSGSGVLWMLLAGVVVVALGSAGGIALRRRR